MNRVELSPKLVSETETATFDFSSRLLPGVTISTQVCTAAVYSGTDATPSAIISGAATLSGAIVSQKITAGTEGVIYEVTCTVTTSDGQTLILVGYLAMVQKLP